MNYLEKKEIPDFPLEEPYYAENIKWTSKFNFDFEENYFPENSIKTVKIDSFEKNCLMIDESTVCIFYYDYSFDNNERIIKSSLRYANKKQKPIINVFENYNIPFI